MKKTATKPKVEAVKKEKKEKFDFMKMIAKKKK
jgi:hypothetical protein